MGDTERKCGNCEHYAIYKMECRCPVPAWLDDAIALIKRPILGSYEGSTCEAFKERDGD